MFDIHFDGDLSQRNQHFLEESSEKLKLMGGNENSQAFLTLQLMESLEAIGGISDKVIEQVN